MPASSSVAAHHVWQSSIVVAISAALAIGLFALQARAVESASRATLLSTARYRSGYVSQLELLDARRSELSSRRLALQVRAAQYLSTVGLISAIGGGWDTCGPPRPQ